MDAAHWSEGLGVVKSMEEKKTTITTTTTTRPQQKPQALNCPRCNSSHTKFCYYNNYSLSQPRYFCKTCRRYWTEGGSLRNVPVGGGSRRNKRSSSSSNPTAAAASVSKINQQQHQMMMVPPSLITQQNPNKTIIQNHGGQSQGQGQGQDLNLGYTTTNVSLQFGNNNLPYNNPNTTTSTTSSSSQFSAMEFLKSGGFADPRMAMMNSIPNNMIMNPPPPPAGLNFSLDGFQNSGGYHHHQHQHQHQNQHLQGTMSTITTTGGTSENARILFPFEDLKQPISTTNNSEMLEATRGQGESSSGGYWGGGLGGGSW